MSVKQNRTIIVVVLLLLGAAYGIRRSEVVPASTTAQATRRAPSDRSIVVDQTSLVVVEQLIRMPTSADERAIAEDALRTADNEMDLAFAQAVRRTLNRPRVNSPEANEADDRLQKSLRSLASEQTQITALTAEVAKANAAAAEGLTDRLNLVKAQAALDQDEADDARQDLRRAGGDPQGQMQDMIEQHDAASKSSDSVHVVVTTTASAPGLVGDLRYLQLLIEKKALVERAGVIADSLARHFKQRHDSVEARSASALRTQPAPGVSHDSAAALLASTQRRALDGKIRATLDERVDNQHRLSNDYAGWTTVLAAQQRAAVNGIMRKVALMLAIVLVAMLVARWMASALGAHAMDKRRVQTLYMIARVSLQIIVVLLVLLVILGPPDNLGTIVGLAGAGLTVAFKDFILGFAGWFVLMGRNGIRIGDLVEINGVTGEVVELGVFYTTLLETGGWTDPDHPTGRRVSFTNGFAIERHFFNFSTSGRWLWDDVKIVVPQGRDAHAIADALQKQVDDATKATAREAELEWREARRLPQSSAEPAAASVSLRPIAGGVEITVRYVTRITERENVRSELYRTAMEMLGGEAATPPARPAAPRTPAA